MTYGDILRDFWERIWLTITLHDVWQTVRDSEVAYGLSIDTKISDHAWPWTTADARSAVAVVLVPRHN